MLLISKYSVNEKTVVEFYGKLYTAKEFAVQFTEGDITRACGAMTVLLNKGSAKLCESRREDKKAFEYSNDIHNESKKNKFDYATSTNNNNLSQDNLLTSLLQVTSPQIRNLGYDTVLRYFDSQNQETFYGEFQWFRITSAVVGYIIATNKQGSVANTMMGLYMKSLLDMTKRIDKNDGKYLTKHEVLKFINDMGFGLGVFGIASEQDFMDAWHYVNIW